MNTFQIQLDLSSDREVQGETACFRLQIGDQWSQPLTPSELKAVMTVAQDKRAVARDSRTADILAALETSALFNFRTKSDPRSLKRAGDAIIAEGRKDQFSKPGVKYLGDVQVRKVPMTRGAIRALGIKNPDSKLYIKPRATGEATESKKAKYDEIVADLNLDLSAMLKGVK